MCKTFLITRWGKVGGDLQQINQSTPPHLTASLEYVVSPHLQSHAQLILVAFVIMQDRLKEMHREQKGNNDALM